MFKLATLRREIVSMGGWTGSRDANQSRQGAPQAPGPPGERSLFAGVGAEGW